MVKENNFNKSNAFDSVAQGTIEYLVIIAVVVVLSLVVVILMLNQTSTVSEADQKMTNLEWKTKEVKIMDFAVSGDGEGQIVLSSNLLNEITINSIVVDSKEISVVDGQIFFNGLAKFSLDEITNCVARGNQEYKITINYTTKEGLSKKITGVFYANCIGAIQVEGVGDEEGGDENDGDEEGDDEEGDEEEPEPVSLSVNIISPQEQSIFYEKNLTFKFTPSISSGEINSCTLRVGDDSNTYTGITNEVENTINYTIPEDLGSFDWDINCSSGETWGISKSRVLTIIGTDAIQLSTCQQLQQIDKNADTRAKNYIVIQDINCYNDTTFGGALYNDGAGFKPIGTRGENGEFKGNFNGGGHTISGLNINRSSDYVGLFGSIGANASVQNLILKDANIIGSNFVGSVIGYALDSNVSKISVTFDSIKGNSYMGGIVGYIYTSSNKLVNFSDLNANIKSITGRSYIGGIVGRTEAPSTNNTTGVLFNKLNARISDKIYSTGGYYVGGLGGYVYSVGSTIRNSGVDVNYISVIGDNTQYIGGLVGNMDGNVYDSYSVARIDVNKSSSSNFIYLGGLAGKANFVDGCYSDVNIDASIGNYSGGTNGGGYIGGLVGYSKYGVMGSSSRGDFILANKTNGSYVGGLVGSTTGLVVDSNAFFDEIRGYNSVGGLVGGYSVGSGGGGYLRGLFADVGVVSASYGYYSQVGGLVGYLSGSSNVLVDFNDSSVRVGVVSGGNYVGGAVGWSYSSSNNDATGVLFNNLDVNVYDKIISTGHDVGGLVGNIFSKGGSIRDSRADINQILVIGNPQYVGGLVGNMDGNVYDSRVVFGRIDVNKNGGDFGYFGGLGGSVGFVSGCSSVGEGIDATLGVWSGGSNRGYVGGLVGYSKYGVMGSSSRGDFILANKTNGSYVGGLVGSTTGLVVDSNAFFDEIRGYNSVGGLVGGYSVGSGGGGYLRGLFADVGVVSASYGYYSQVGGLVGYLFGSSNVLVDFNDSSVRVWVVSGGNYVGGAVGWSYSYSNNDATGVLFNNLDVNVYGKIISTGHDVGGLVGNIFSKGGSIRDSRADINQILVIGNPQYVGGLVGKTDGNIYNSYSVAQIDVNKNSSSPDYLYLGGLAGQASFIDECYSDVNIDISIGNYSGKRVGGLVGLIDKGVKNSYSKGGYILATKTNGNSIGGLIGYLDSPNVLIENSYSSIEEIIKGNNHYVGGLIGYAIDNTVVTNSFSTTTMNSTGGSNIGGLIGYPSPVSGCTNSYYLEGNEVMLYSSSPTSVSSDGKDYFKGNLTNEPMHNWPTLIWVSEVNNYPQLIN